ncbi:MAG: response regulator transcription factor [Dissulfurispiraceae bacterium]|jgi:twitching motility two-component system response regulator PilH
MAKILIAEDSTTDLKFIESILLDKGHQISIAKDGEEAEKIIKSQSFDIIILDVVMPKKNGFQLCRLIKKDEKLKTTPVIMVTSKSQEADKLWGKQQGADFYLTKPYEPTELLFAVNKFLSR